MIEIQVSQTISNVICRTSYHPHMFEIVIFALRLKVLGVFISELNSKTGGDSGAAVLLLLLRRVPTVEPAFVGVRPRQRRSLAPVLLATDSRGNASVDDKQYITIDLVRIVNTTHS